MLYTTFKKNKLQPITSISLSLVSFLTILTRCFADGLLGTEQLLNNYTGQVVTMLIIYLLMNLLYKFINNGNFSINMVPIYLGVGGIISFWSTLFISYLSSEYLSLKLIVCYLLFFIVHFIQFLLNQIFYKRLESWLTRYYIIVLVLTSLFINMELYQVPTGVVLIGLLVIISQKIFKGESQSLLVGTIILLDALLFLFYDSSNLICSLYGILQLGLIGYILWERLLLKNGPVSIA